MELQLATERNDWESREISALAEIDALNERLSEALMTLENIERNSKI